MKRNQKIAVAASIALALGAVTFTMWTGHSSRVSNPARYKADVIDQIDENAIAKALGEKNLGISNLTVRSAGPIVILRGSGSVESALQAAAIVKSMGVSRIANLIDTSVIDDNAVRRDAERQLARTTSLDGCLLKVHCEKGVITVTGTVVHELQKDVARSALRGIHGAREVKLDLSL
jgi:osmotically-inducible protein OsmY